MPAIDKKLAINEVLNNKKSVNEVASKLGVARKTVYQWIRKYNQASPRIKKTILDPQYKYGKDHPRELKHKVKFNLLRLLIKHPEWGSRKYHQYLCTQGFNISHTTIYRLLKDISASSKSLREKIGSEYAGPGRISLDKKAVIVESIINGKQTISDLSKKHGISRKAIYQWVNSYQSALKKGLQGKEGLKEKYASYEDHPKAIYPQIQGELLNTVANNPKLSHQHLAKLYNVAPTTIWHILDRYNLNNYSDRLLYASKFGQVVQTPAVSQIVDSVSLPVLDQLSPNVMPGPPPPKDKKALGQETTPLVSSPTTSPVKPISHTPIWLWISLSFIISLASGVTMLNIVAGLIVADSLGKTIGIIFSGIALTSGTFFFLYSLKYYLTIMVVLIFSRSLSKEEIGKTQLNSNSALGVDSWGKDSSDLGLSNSASDLGNVGNIANIDNLSNSISSVSSSLKSSTLVRSMTELTQALRTGLYPDLSRVELDRHPFVSIHLPLFNEKRVVNRLLEAVTSMDYDNYEVIVADDSTDETRDVVNEWINHPRIKISHRDSRQGFKGGALKEALKFIDPKAEFILVLDADFLPYPDTIQQFLKYFAVAFGSLDPNVYTSSPTAAVQGYQWHVLNKSENWITRGVRTEFAGSYVIERSGVEVYGGLKQIAGSVFMIRADLLRSPKYQWGTSITEDFELTLKLYRDGYKVIYTPYIQAPSECVSTLKRLIRQRMRWAEGHSHNIKRMFAQLLNSKNPTFMEKFEFVYLAPYYLQSALFLLGTLAWFVAETLFQVKLPFWTEIWGWSLVLTNLLSLPLMNTVGLFLEEAEEKDYAGIPSFVLMSYLVAPFQAYAAVKGFLEQEEGPWFRTPKTGRITDTFTRGKFYRWLSGLFGQLDPGTSAKTIIPVKFAIKKSPIRNTRQLARIFIATLLIISLNISYLASTVTLSTRGLSGTKFAFGAEGDDSVTSNDQNKIISPLIEPINTISLESTNKTFLSEISSKILEQIKNIGQRVKNEKQPSSLLKSLAFNTKPTKPDFMGDERPSFKFKRTGKNWVQNIQIWFEKTKQQILKTDPANISGQVQIKVSDPFGNVVQTLDSQVGFSESTVEIDASLLKPGRSKVVITDTATGNIIEQDFTWGVLAINTNKSIYVPGETARFDIAVLNDTGRTVCDAKLTLLVTAPSGAVETLTTEAGTIKVNQEACSTREYTLIPDYEASYKIEEAGVHSLELYAETNRGAYKIKDSFDASHETVFVVERVSATRIYPLSKYKVSLQVNSKLNFSGKVEETVPLEFVISETEGIVSNNDLAVQKQTGQKPIYWNVDWKAGQTYTLEYTYDAPDISPEFYTLGPLKILQGEKVIFTESRTWSIAVDATSGSTSFYLQSQDISEENSTYNSMLPHVLPEADNNSAGTDNSTQNFSTPPCEAGGFDQDNSARVNDETASIERCVATFYSAIAGSNMVFETGDTNSISYNMYALEEGNASTATIKAYLYEYVESGSTYNLIDTSNSAAVTSNTLTNVTWSSTPDSSVTVDAGNRLAVVFTVSTGSTPDGTSGTDTFDVHFDRSTSAPAYMAVSYTLTTGDKPTLTGLNDDDFDENGSCASSCDGTTLLTNPQWNIQTSGNSTTESVVSHGSGSSQWIDITDVKTANGVGTDLSNYTYMYQTPPTGDIDITTQVSIAGSRRSTTSPGNLGALILRFTSDTDFLALEVWDNGTNFVVQANDDGVLGTSATIDSYRNDVILGFSRSGSNYQPKYCISSTTDCSSIANFTNVGSALTSNGGAFDQVGIGSYVEYVTTDSLQSTAAFEWFKISTITVSGNVYDFGTSNALTECDASTSTYELSLRSGSTTYTASCDDATGAYSFTGVTKPASGAGLVAWINDLTPNGAVVIRYDGSGDSTGNTFYDDAVTIRTDDSNGVTIDMLNTYDSADDADIPYTATNATPDTLTVTDAYTLLIPSGEVFAPGGNLNNGSGAGVDDIDISGTYTAATGESILVSGNWSQSGTFTASTSTVTFDAPGATTENIYTTGSGAFNNIVFNDGGGGATWEIEDTLDVDGNLTITGGTVDVVNGENNQINVGGNWTNDDIFVERSGKVVFDTSTTATLDSNCSDVGTCTNENFYDLELSKSASGNTVTLTNFGIRVTSTLTLTTGTLVQGAYNVRVEGASAVSVAANGIWSNTSTGDLTLAGTFDNLGTVTFQGNGTACGGADGITIGSTTSDDRNWTGDTGTFNFNDVVVNDMTSTPTINVYSGSGTAGANWVFNASCPAISGLTITANSSTIQVDAPNRYRAIMNLGDTDDYMTIADRAESDGSPDVTHELKGPCILETNTYCLRDDSTRRSTVLEATSVRVRVRVEGRLNNEASTDYLADESATPQDLTVIEDYTFTLEGIFVSNTTDFRTTGVTLDSSSGHNGYDWLGVYTDVTDAAYDDAGNLIYGNGETEGTTTTDGVAIANSNTYAVMQATGTSTYQDAMIGIQRTGWYDDTTGGTHQWYWDEGESGTQDLLAAQEQNHLTVGVHKMNWYFSLQAEDDLNTEVERESRINDFRNPDILTYTIGSEWNDVPVASSGLTFDGTNDGVYYSESGTTALDISSSYTIETWVNFGEALASQDVGGEIVAKARNAGNSEFNYSLVYSSPAGNVTCTFNDVSVAQSVNSTGFSPVVDTWHHVACVFDDSGNTFTIYVDGVQNNQATGITTTPNPGDGRLDLGDDTVNLGYSHDGSIDEVRIWNTNRTLAQLQQNMFNQIDPASSNLVAYYRLNENTGTVSYDETTNNFDLSNFVNTTSWTTGFVPDHYNEAEGAYTVNMSSNQAQVDIDGQANTSTLLSGALTAGSTTVVVDDASGFPASGVGYIDGDKFSYTSITDSTTDTFNEVPSSGELSVIGHADNTVVSSMNRYKPVYKVKEYRNNTLPSIITMEGVTLTSGTDYHVDYKPVSGSSWDQDLLWYSTLETSGATTSPDVGTTTSTDCTFTTGKYGNGALCDADAEEIQVPMSGNVGTTQGTIEFWYKNTTTPGNYANFFDTNDAGADVFTLERRNSDTIIGFNINYTGFTDWSGVPNVFDGEWHHIRLTYQTSGTDSHHLYIDGVDQGNKTTDYPTISGTPTTLIIGSENGGAGSTAAGIIDEFKIYDTITSPKKLAEGGDTGDADEYLFDASADQTFSFAEKDSTERGEYAYFGSDSMMSGLNVDLATLGEGNNLDLNWEYWNGSAWTDLESISGFTDGTSNLTADGAVYWSVNPTNWRPYSVNCGPDLYYIRASLDYDAGVTREYTTSPIEDTIKTDIVTFLYLNTLSSNDQTLVVPEYIGLFMPVILVGVWVLRRKDCKKRAEFGKTV